jgi:hypothetical protein
MSLHCYLTGSVFGELVPARPERAWMDAFTDRHAYRCLPLAIANAFGWHVLSPCTVDIAYSGGDRQEDIELSSPDGAEILTHVAKSNFSRGIVTFHTGYLFRTDPDWQLLATGPFNEPKDGLAPLTGVIETSWLPYPFTMNWQLTRPGQFRFTKGEPICHILPVPVGHLDEVTPEIFRLEDDPALKGEYEAFRDKRAEFMKRFHSGDPATLKEAWQRFYFRGRLPTGTVAPASHTHKLRLANPVDRRGTAPTPPQAAPAATPAGESAAVETTVAGGAETPQLAATGRTPTSRTIRIRLVSRQSDSDAFLYQEDLLTPEHCRLLIDVFERHHNLTAPTSDVFFSGRVIWMTRIPAEERDALRIMQQARFVACHQVGRFFAHPRPLLDDAPQLVKWPTGYAMPPHADNQHPDGSPNQTPHRLFAGVLYLNDDFEGGMLVLDRLGLGVRPRPGLLVGFRGDDRHRHAVTRITKGERYTMPMWFTDDPAKADPSLLKVF